MGQDSPDKGLIRLALGAAKRRQSRFGPALVDLMIAWVSRPDDPGVHMELACVYAVLGAQTRALSHFEKAYRLSGPEILSHLPDPHLDPIRLLERFQLIVRLARREHQAGKEAQRDREQSRAGTEPEAVIE